MVSDPCHGASPASGGEKESPPETTPPVGPLPSIQNPKSRIHNRTSSPTHSGEKPVERPGGFRLPMILATGFGVGYSPLAPGTLGSLLGVALYCAFLPFGALHITVPAVSAVLFFAGVHLSFLAEAHFREKDCQRIVFDELASFPLTMALISPSLLRVALAFAFNRAADILKPFPAGRIQRLKGGWGVMLDDTIAALYGNLLLRLVILAFHV